MPAFKITSIVNGDTFEVLPEWKWNGKTRTRFRPTSSVLCNCTPPMDRKRIMFCQRLSMGSSGPTGLRSICREQKPY